MEKHGIKTLQQRHLDEGARQDAELKRMAREYRHECLSAARGILIALATILAAGIIYAIWRVL